MKYSMNQNSNINDGDGCGVSETNKQPRKKTESINTPTATSPATGEKWQKRALVEQKPQNLFMLVKQKTYTWHL